MAIKRTDSNNQQPINPEVNQAAQGNPMNEQYTNQQYTAGSEIPNAISGVGMETAGLKGLAGLQSMYGSVIPVETGSNILNGYLEQFRETYNDKKKNSSIAVDLEFVALPQETLQLSYSGIAVCYKHQNGVTIHTLLLEDDGPTPDPRTFSISPHETVEIPTTPGDTYNTHYMDTVRAHVQHKFPSAQLHDGGMQVVYRTINMDDPNQVNRLLSEAANAAVGATSLNTAGADIANGRTLANTLSSNGIQLHAAINTAPAPMVTPNGLPVRRDFVVKSTATVPGSTQNNLRGTRAGGFLFSEVSAFATLEYVAPPEQPYNNYGQPVMPQVTQRYVPRIVITNVNSGGINTLPAILLGISTATVMQEGVLWTEPFRPTHGRSKGDVDIRDIGAIGYDIKELNPDDKPGLINTKSNTFTTKDFYDLMAATVYPTPMYSIDIEEAGSMSWLTSVFTHAAAGVPEAKRAIIDACNSLTNNTFSKYFADNDTILQDDENRVFLGTYRPIDDPNGDLKDIRTLDYLAILNLSKGSTNLVEDYEKSQRANGGSPAARLSTLYDILNEIFAGSLKISGYANRFTFHSNFIEALAKSTREAKVAPMFSNLPQHVQENARARADQFAWAMVNTQNIGGVYQGGQGFTQQGTMLSPAQSAWGQNYYGQR